MKALLASILLLATSLAPAYAGEVKLQVANGRITLQARDATVREILAEWARVGQVKIINGEKIAGAPLTLDLQDVPEVQALNTLLRSVSGYMAAPKSQLVSGASIYDRIVVMATPRAAAVSTNYTAPPQQQLQFRQGMPPGMQNPAMLDEEDPVGAPIYPGAPGYPNMQRGNFVTPQMQLQQMGAGGGQAPVSPSGLPLGAPGTVSPVPQMPGVAQPGLLLQPGTGAPGTVSQPVKKPGGPGGTGPGGTGPGGE